MSLEITPYIVYYKNPKSKKELTAICTDMVCVHEFFEYLIYNLYSKQFPMDNLMYETYEIKGNTLYVRGKSKDSKITGTTCITALPAYTDDTMGFDTNEVYMVNVKGTILKQEHQHKFFVKKEDAEKFAVEIKQMYTPIPDSIKHTKKTEYTDPDGTQYTLTSVSYTPNYIKTKVENVQFLVQNQF